MFDLMRVGNEVKALSTENDCVKTEDMPNRNDSDCNKLCIKK